MTETATVRPSLRSYAVACPACGAEPRQRCTDAGKRIDDVHEARREAARR